MSMSGGQYPAPRATPGVVQRQVTAGAAARFMFGWVVLLWVIEAVDVLSGNLLDNFAIHARDPQGLAFIFTAPLLHFGWQHLISNTVPFFVLGWFVYISGRAQWWVTTLLVVVVSGLFAWAFTPAGAYVAGASGLIFGWFAYLVVRGIWTRDWRQILIAVGLVAVYGGMIWGVLPTDSGVSWQAHLGGVVGGVVAAAVIGRRGMSTVGGRPGREVTARRVG
ncbi:MAG: rhomboid family intramembrane serine protease [Raineyella sp.]|nr:rhomboid family intramembrane serine protease [Raineyella sp.]MEA5155092.1 rhomboid family intramembrane serine protease [Raineyella sp.]